MRFIQKHKIKLAFAILGAVGGFLYWKFVGCQSGTCPIKSVWYLTTLWGTAIGYLLGDIISGYVKKKEIKENE
jgi:hypothetical protein